VAEVAAAFIEGPVTAMAPASVLQMHPDCVCILDRQAAVKLKNQEFYRWVYSRKPDWQRIGPPPRQP
jgi:glucosamine-6-phosphate deaminase